MTQKIRVTPRGRLAIRATLLAVALGSLAPVVLAAEDGTADPRQEAALRARIAPVGKVNTGKMETAAAPAAAAAHADPAATYKSTCAACHGGGLPTAPKVGDAGQWKARIAKGKEALYASALNGTPGGMPPRGGSSLDDDTIKAVVDYMVAQSQ